MRIQYLSAKDRVVINNATFIWDHERKHLILMLKTNREIGSGINVTIHEDKLILETLLESSCNRPLRTHLLGKENREEFEEGLFETRFSEIQLNPGYEFEVVSSRVLEPSLVKVILEFRLSGILEQ